MIVLVMFLEIILWVKLQQSGLIGILVRYQNGIELVNQSIKYFTQFEN